MTVFEAGSIIRRLATLLIAPLHVVIGLTHAHSTGGAAPPRHAPVSATAPSAQTVAAPAPSESGTSGSPPPGSFRVEDDCFSGLKFRGGVAYPLRDGFGLAAGIYLAESLPAVSGSHINGATSIAQTWWSKYDIGPTISLGPKSLAPEVGIAFDFATKRALALNVPRIDATLDFGRFHFESWLWNILYSSFYTPNNDHVHTRNWLPYKLLGTLLLGPELKFNINLNDTYGTKGLVSLPVGGRFELNLGSSKVAALVGYQTDKDSRGPNGQAAVGRLAFVHNS